MQKRLSNMESQKDWAIFTLSISFVFVTIILGILIGMLISYNRIVNAELLARSRADFDNIVLSRRWNASYGGVFVEKTEGMLSNPYLVNPDITTIDGKVYTKKNPALMTREISEIAERDGFFQFHITSLNPLNPGNTPDAWETDALTAFAEGLAEDMTTESDGDDTFFRYMAPLVTEESCLKCHAIQGYKEGDIRGGISIRFNISDVKKSIRQNNALVIGFFVLIALSTVALLFIFVSILSKKIKSKNETILIERDKSEKLLLNVLPARVASDLKEHGKAEPEVFENVSVFFSDIVGFTDQSSRINPAKLISELNRLFTVFDEIMEENQCERIKTIGDAYLAVCGMPVPNENHAKHMINSAIEIRDYLSNLEDDKMQWKIRIGIHSGSVVGGIVGVKKYIYDVFGDTINTASRMESNSEPMHINISETTYKLTRNDYDFVERESTEVKGKGKMAMYFVENTSTTRTSSIAHNRRSSARFPINTAIQIVIGSDNYDCEAVDVSADGGMLLVAKNKKIGRINPDLIGGSISMISVLNEDRIEGKLVRYFKREDKHYFGIQY